MRAQHLFFRGKTYYFVARVPLDVCRYFPVSTLWKSLKTGDRKNALVLIRRLEFMTERLYMQIRSGMISEEGIKQLVADYFHDELDRRERIRGDRPCLSFNDKSADLDSAFQRREAALTQKKIASRHVGCPEGLRMEIARRLQSHGYQPIEEPRELWEIAKHFLIAKKRVQEIEAERVIGNYDSDVERNAFAAYPRREGCLTLKQLVDIYTEDRITEKKWESPKTICDMKSSYSLLLRIKGDFVVDRIDYEFARDFRNILMKLPPNSSKGRYAGKTVPEILAMPGIEPMKVENVNKNIRRMAELFKFGCKKGLVGRNPFEGMEIKETVLAHEKKRPFVKTELATIVRYLFAMLERKLHDGRIWIEPEHIFMFLLGIFTGFRSNEICQMLPEDVFEFDGMWCMAVKHEPKKGQTTKNAHSRRVIPVPPQMISLRFLEHVERVQAVAVEGARLWATVSKDSYGKWNRKFGDRINDYIDNALGGQDKSVSFHSTRHNLGNALDDCDVKLKTIQDIKGHSSKSTEERHYLKRKLQQQYDALSSVDYGLDLEWIRDELKRLSVK